MKIMITGGRGFIGSYVVMDLLAGAEAVIHVDRAVAPAQGTNLTRLGGHRHDGDAGDVLARLSDVLDSQPQHGADQLEPAADVAGGQHGVM
jgi:nucleoside-diphosphate-sugar epimerase